MGEHISAHNSWPLRESKNSSSLSCWPPPRIDSEDSGDRKRGTIPTRSPTGAGAGGAGLSCPHVEANHPPPRRAATADKHHRTAKEQAYPRTRNLGVPTSLEPL